MTIFAKKSKKSKIFKVKKKIFSEKKKKNSFSLKHKLCFECHTRLSTRGMVGVIWILKKFIFCKKTRFHEWTKWLFLRFSLVGGPVLTEVGEGGGTWSKNRKVLFWLILALNYGRNIYDGIWMCFRTILGRKLKMLHLVLL